MFKLERTEEFMEKVRARLYYVHMNLHNRINFKHQRVLNMLFHILV